MEDTLSRRRGGGIEARRKGGDRQCECMWGARGRGGSRVGDRNRRFPASIGAGCIGLRSEASARGAPSSSIRPSLRTHD